ncbi:uncharacterized protein UDID_18168 [Ustilago sp. UG-2017a]|nr:uncharacterized protein UDID_18168 [Ustilago sp. UG-2017a]
MSKMGERSHPDPESINNETPPGVDVEAIVQTVTTQLSHTLNKHFRQLTASLTPHNVTTKSESQHHQQVEAEASEAANLAQPHNTVESVHLESTTSNGLRRPTIKPDDIGMYDGSADNLKFFLGRMKSLIKNTALHWYKVLSSHRHAELNTGWTVWELSLCNAFQPDASKIRHLAGEQKWEWLKESIASYFYTKLSLLHAVFPTCQEADLLNEIRYGLPASLQLNVHYNSRNNPVPQQLTLPSTYSTPTHPLSSAVNTPRIETPFPHQDINTPNKFGLTTNYNPANISYIDRDGRCVWTYKLPNSRQTITLGRPCRSCSQDHFNFEHDFLSRQPKGEAHIAHDELKLACAYGYSTICPEPVWVGEDEYISSPGTSFKTSSSQSNVPPNSLIHHPNTPI